MQLEFSGVRLFPLSEMLTSSFSMTYRPLSVRSLCPRLQQSRLVLHRNVLTLFHLTVPTMLTLFTCLPRTVKLPAGVWFRAHGPAKRMGKRNKERNKWQREKNNLWDFFPCVHGVARCGTPQLKHEMRQTRAEGLNIENIASLQTMFAFSVFSLILCREYGHIGTMQNFVFIFYCKTSQKDNKHKNEQRKNNSDKQHCC